MDESEHRRDGTAETAEAEQIPAWAETVITAHVSVAGSAVSHAARLKSRRYFIWTEDGGEDFCADNAHDERAVKGVTDLFTEREFDVWARRIGRAFDLAGMLWEYTGTTYEPDTKLFHHSWEWTVI